MGKWKLLGTVVEVATRVKLGSGSSRRHGWSNVLAPGKASRIISRVNTKNNKISKRNKLGSSIKDKKPNPDFDKLKWKNSDKPKNFGKNRNGNISTENQTSTGKYSKPLSKKGSILKPGGDQVKINSGRSRKKSVRIVEKTKKASSQAKNEQEFKQTEKNIMSTSITKPTSNVSSYWKKIRLMLVYMKIRNPGILSLSSKCSDVNKNPGLSITSNLEAIKMADKFKEYRHREKNSVPSSGGKRGPGEFDYLGINKCPA